MWINIIDYRGDSTVINSRGDSLFAYRTKYFHKIQEDFYLWKQHGHKFRCFTQHENRNTFVDDYWAFDDVIKIPRSNAPQARNHVHNFYPLDNWIGLWDNDATLYWDKLRSSEVPRDLEILCSQADNQGIRAWVPFNAQQAPYPKKVPDDWTFKPTIQLKGTMTFVKTSSLRHNELQPSRDDVEYAFQLTLQGHKIGMLQQASLNELVCGKSTVFKVNAYHEAYKKPGPGANPNGLLQWDAQLDRIEQYAKADAEWMNIYGITLKDFAAKQRELWK